MTFNELNLIAPILKALETEGYTTPTPIQQQAIPIVLSRKDLLGCAQTGTGKTAAFAIPILQLLHGEHAERNHRHIKVLVLTPTRELAIQIGESFGAYGRNLQQRHTVIFGGVPQGAQVQILKKGVDILIATPGRLLDLIGQGFISLKDIGIFVLDEADRMLDMGFIHDVKRLVAQLPQRRQTLFFSATMPPEIQKLANTILVKPEMVEVTPPATTAELINQSVYFVDKKDKRSLLHHVLQDAAIGRVLIFTRTKHGADKVVKDLHKVNIRAEAIHGNKSQNARQRALSNFKEGSIRALIATDIAARGIDVDLLSHVINYEIPEVPETYVHRIGRTGRAGASGIAISFCDNEEMTDWKNILKLIKTPVDVVTGHPFPLTGSGQITINLPKNKEVVRRPNAVPGATSASSRQGNQRNGNNRNSTSRNDNSNRNAGGNNTGKPNGNSTTAAKSTAPAENAVTNVPATNARPQNNNAVQNTNRQNPNPNRSQEQSNRKHEQKAKEPQGKPATQRDDDDIWLKPMGF